MIDFTKIPEVARESIHGGVGPVYCHIFDDKKVRILTSVFKPGTSVGLHTHTNDLEIVYVLKGEAVFYVDGVKEIVKEGQVHYCPCGSNHSMVNESQSDVVTLSIIPLVKGH